MRYLRPDPVTEDEIRRVLAAAACASSPGNSQGWDFLVVRDAGTRAEIAREMQAGVRPLLPPVPDGGDPSRRAMLAGAHHLLDHLAEVPVWIFVCGRPVYPAASPSADWIPHAVFPAAQNLIVAARSLGLGTTFTTYHMTCEQRIRELLEIPAEAHIAVSIAMGKPARPFGRLKRKPLEELVHWERWNRRAAAA